MRNQHQHARIIGGLWLSRAALSFVALAAIMGWGASFVGLHAYGLDQMVGFSYWTAWLVPGTFDGAAFGATLITYRASIHGRSAVRGRLLMWTFTGISSWINWIHQVTSEAQVVAAGLPVAAVAVFDVVLAELRADYEERHGKRRLRLRPGLLALRWLVDRTGTSGAFRQQVTDIPVSEIAGLGQVPTEHGQEPAVITMSRPGEETASPERTSHNAAPSETPSTAGSAERPAATHIAVSEHTAQPDRSRSDRSAPRESDAAPTKRSNQADEPDTSGQAAEDEPAPGNEPVPRNGQVAENQQDTGIKRAEPTNSSRSIPSATSSEDTVTLASPLMNGSPQSSAEAENVPANHAERTRPGILLPFTPNGEQNGAVPTSDRSNPPAAPALTRSQFGQGPDSFAQRWARARNEVTVDQREEDQPQLLVIDRRGGQPARTSQPARAPESTAENTSNGSHH